MSEYKQVILVRMDLKMSKGKIASQVSHASVEAVLRSTSSKVKAWREEGMAKIVLKVKDKGELMKHKQIAKDYGLITAVIQDAGRTEIEPGTITCLAIGPDDEEKIDKVTGNLKIL
jgi:peptidyl-tRNA hydrolase, PTH2 family